MDALRALIRAPLATIASNNDDQVLYQRSGGALHVVLNRPKALNSLTLEMVRSLSKALPTWREEGEGAPSVVVLRGAGGKAFCAGGDIKEIYENGKRGDAAGGHAAQEAFFSEEYALDLALAELGKRIPTVAVWDGAVMGGGLGISMHSTFRIATERTVFAMPETAIGFFPDVGASYFLPRLRAGPAFGLYLALTGARLLGVDAVYAGAATHFLSSEKIPELLDRLSKVKATGAGKSHEEVRKVVTALQPAAILPSVAYTNSELAKIESCFSPSVHRSVESIVAECDKQYPAGASKTAVGDAIAALRRVSPTSLKITFEQLRRGGMGDRTLASCYEMEFRMAKACARENDFYEGVRALLVDKDNKPKWRPAKLEEVTERDVAKYFA